jgi:hypothetical protein
LELHRQTLNEVRPLRELNTEETWIIREPINEHRAERNAEMTSEESTQTREINTRQQRASETRRVQRFVGSPIVKLEDFQEQLYRHQLPPMSEICQFCQAVKWKDETARAAVIAEKLCLRR